MPERDVTFDVGARDRTGPGTKAAADNFERVGRAADKAARKIDEVGDQAGQTARKLTEARLAAMGLAREFDKTGDVKVLRNFEKLNREAAKLGRVAKSLKFDAPKIENPDGFLGSLTKLGRKAGLVASDAAVEGFGSLFKALPAQVKAGMVLGASAGAAYLAAATEGAILAGVGAAAIGGTLLIAAQNEKVKQSYGALGQRIMVQLQDAAKPMTEELLATAPKLSAAFDREAPTIERIMRNATRDFGPVVEGVEAAIHRFLPSFERAADVGGKILANVAGQLPALAGALGHLFDAFANSGRGANAGINELIMNVRVLIEAMALLAQAGAPALNTIGRVMELMGLVSTSSSQLTTLASASEQAALSGSSMSTSYEVLAQSMGNTANQANALNDAFNRLFGAQMSVDQANLAVKQGVVNLTESVKQNGKTLDDSTQKGLNNIGMIQQQIQNLAAKRDADIAAGNGTVEATNKANAAYASNVASLRQLLINLGFAADKVDALIGKYQSIPQSISTTVTTVYRTQGTPPGYADEKTGHSRTGSMDYSGLDGWAPAQFSAGQRAFAAAAATASAPTQPPVQVHSESSFTVLLDGTPFRAQIVRTTAAAESRQAYRARVGTV